MSTPDHYDDLYRQRGVDEALRIAVDDARKLRAFVERAVPWSAVLCIEREASSGLITKDDGDTVKWETTLTPVEF